jgi:CRISPR/Cas system-associated endoribonuclease Cas2
MKDYLLCYDIADETRLYYVRKYAYSLALGGQKSALETPLSTHEAKRILTTLINEIDEEEDRINIIEVEKEPLYLGVKPAIIITQGAIIL